MNILVLDCGTSGLKAIVFDSHGQILKKTGRQYTPEYFENKAEMDISIVEDCLWDALAEISSWCLRNKVSIGSVSVTAQRSSVIPVDRNGAPLRQALMWQDKRSAILCEEYQAKAKEIYSICGMLPSPVFSAPKIVWLKRNEQDIYDKAYKLVGFQEIILHSLTGEFVTDTTIAGRSCLMDIERLAWSPVLLDLFGVDPDKLCRIVPAGSICGATNTRFSKVFGSGAALPVVTAGGDQQCAAVGHGCISPTDIEINAGTGAYVLAVTEKPILDREKRVLCNPSAMTGRWIVEGSVLSCGSAIDWMNNAFFLQEKQSRPYENFDIAAASSPPGSNGLRILPYFNGKGTPGWDPAATAQISNLGFHHKKADFARALIEGIAMEIGECAETAAQVCGLSLSGPVPFGGGVSENALFVDILANVLGCTVSVPDCQDATALGAWISAAAANHLFPTCEEAFHEASRHIKVRLFEAVPEKTAFYAAMMESRKACMQKDKNRSIMNFAGGRQDA